MHIYEIKQRALLDAIRFCGSIKKYSDLIGATRTQVGNWIADPRIKIAYEYAILTELHTNIKVEKLSPEKGLANQAWRNRIGSIHKNISLPINEINIESSLKLYYRINTLENNISLPIIINQDKTLIAGYARLLECKKK